MRRKVKPISGGTYHIYNRGVNYENIFFNPANWQHFLRLLRRYCPPDKADIIAYCLMPNHYHLLVHLHTDTFGETVMQPFMVAYTKAVNKQQGRVGPIFQGPYQAKAVTSDSYLLHLTRYIHLNPVTAGFVDTPAAWDYSSYQEYIGQRAGTLPRPEIILTQFAPQPDPAAAYAQYVCGKSDARAGLVASLLFE